MPETGTGKAMETAGDGAGIGRLNCYPFPSIVEFSETVVIFAKSRYNR